ncbi:20623_t:CDS:1, partial [Gigaspora margarita]
FKPKVKNKYNQARSDGIAQSLSKDKKIVVQTLYNKLLELIK